MVKIKGMNKMLAALLLSASMIFATATTAFAYVDENAEATQTEAAETEKTVIEENTTEEEAPFSVPGNGQVQDDITNSKNKEFLTINTKNNNTFYLVIDRSATVDNVYMLSQIDENDLKEFLEEDQTGSSVVDVTPNIVIDENANTDQNNPTETEDLENPENEESSSNLGALIAIFAAAVLGVGGYGYMKFIKPKKDEDDGDEEGIEMIGESDEIEDEESEDFDN